MEKSKNNYITGVSLLIAAVVVLQTLSATFLKITGYSLALIFIPIIIAGIFYGIKGGTIVGTSFGIMIFLHSFLGMDPAGALFLQHNWYLTILLTVFRGIIVGFLTALIYKYFNRVLKNKLVAVIIVSLCAPLINTIIFSALAYILFYGLLESWAIEANDSNVLHFLMASIYVNFIIEVLTTVIICPPVFKALERSKQFSV